MKLLKLRQPSVTVVLAVIILVATFLRFWNLPETLMFQGDQGRDALIVSRIFTDSDLVFIGPVTSVGNMYLGPLYYYFMLPFLWFSYPSPVGPAYAVAALGVLTVFLVYKWGKELVGERAALIASALYAISSVAVTYSRFSWNPNPAPLVSLAMIYGTYKAWKENPWYWLLVGLCFSVLIQLHYLTLLALAGSGIIWLLQLIEFFRNNALSLKALRLRQFLLATVGAVVIFGISLTPLILFDSRHDWLNAQAFSRMFTQEEAFVTRETKGVGEKVLTTALETHGRSMHILFETTFGQHRTINTLLVLAVIAIWSLKIRTRQSNYWSGEVVILTFLFTGILGTALYEHTIFDHYIAYLFPVTFLILGGSISWLVQKKIGLIPAAIFIGGYVVINLMKLPLTGNSWSIFDMQTVTSSINQRLDENEAYSLVLLSPSGDLYGQNYRYFLSTTNTPALPPERAGEASTLVIINEDHTENVADLPIYEIVTFSEKKLSEVYTINNGPEVLIFRK